MPIWGGNLHGRQRQKGRPLQLGGPLISMHFTGVATP